MGGGGDRHPGELLAGSYDPEQRRKEVLRRLEASFDEIRKMDFRKMVEDETAAIKRKQGGRGRGRPIGGRGVPEVEDVVTMQLNSLKFKIDDLKSDVAKYSGPHFTKQYRTLQGHCAKLQTDLDGLDVSGRENLRKERKKALMDIDDLAKQLASRAHEDGRSCVDCEVQD